MVSLKVPAAIRSQFPGEWSANRKLGQNDVISARLGKARQNECEQHVAVERFDALLAQLPTLPYLDNHIRFADNTLTELRCTATWQAIAACSRDTRAHSCELSTPPDRSPHAMNATAAIRDTAAVRRTILMIDSCNPVPLACPAAIGNSEFPPQIAASMLAVHAAKQP
jgi:hypothetical protein